MGAEEVKVENQPTQPEAAEVTAENTQEIESQEPANNVDEEVVVTIGEDSPPQDEEEKKDAPEWVKELRKSHKEQLKENKELKKQLEKLKGPSGEEITLGAKPKLADYEYDEDAYEKDLDAWYDKKEQVKGIETTKKAKQQTEKQEWQNTLDGYNEKKLALKVKDFDETEEVLRESFSETQQGVLLVSAENPALVAYALGKNEAKLKELSKIKDPIRFAAAIARLETTMKVSNRKKAPSPEGKVQAGGVAVTSGDSHLDKLREEAEKSGDLSKVIAYKKQQKQKE